MRTVVGLITIALLASILIGIAAQELSALTPGEAKQRAVTWMQDFGYQAGSVTSVKRYWPLKTISYRPVYVVSTWVYFVSMEQGLSALCIGVIVNAWNGRIIAAYGGELLWLDCRDPLAGKEA